VYFAVSFAFLVNYTYITFNSLIILFTFSFQSSVRRVALNTGKVHALVFGFSFIV
jgi:hypothetical protein